MSHAGMQLEEVLECVDSRITHEMNEVLIAPFIGNEVREALQGIGDLKAPGADGMPSIFYKKFWSLIRDRIKHEVLNVLNGGPMPQGWNDTIIILCVSALLQRAQNDGKD
jgi:hypothetical protein